ncbi:MAG TPA: hypothetical protein VKO18_03095 [Terriglobia bacterium]|nr:hypothetical protein [Terriglobia bacterium]
MRKGCTYLTAIALLALWATTSRAQQAGAQVGQTLLTAAFPPPQLGTGQTPGSVPDSSQEPVSPPVGTMSPLSGAQVLTPGFTGEAHSFVLPVLGCTEYANTNPTGYKQTSSLLSETTCTAALTLQRLGKHSQLNLDDAGGGMFFSSSLQPGTATSTNRYKVFDELGISEQVSGNRWNWLVGDQGAYLPETPEGFAGLGGGLANYIGGAGGVSTFSNAPSLNSAYQPNQALYTGLSTRFSDLATTEFEYSLSGKSVLTTTALVGTLQYITPGFIDDTYWMLMTGYNYSFGRGDEIALMYEENHFLFTGGNPGFVNRGLSALYGHRINGRLSIELSAAPMVNVIPEPHGRTLTAFFMSTYDSLEYVTGKSIASFSVSRVMAGDAGVATGAERNMVQASYGRRLTQRLHGSVRSSFANTKSIAQQTAGGSLEANYLEAGLNLERDFGRHVSLYLNYNVQRQVSNRSICVGADCATAFLRQVGGIGFNWHVRRVNVE